MTSHRTTARSLASEEEFTLKTSISTLAGALSAALLVTLAGAAVTPDAGTIGTEFTVEFDADVGTKPKLELRYVTPPAGKKAKTPKAKAKLISSDGTSVTFVIQAAKGGGDFTIGAKKSDATAGNLTLASPRVDSVGSAAVAAGGELTIQGQYFGELANKRNAPKVFVNGKKAKVTSFSDAALTITVHKKTATGTADVTVQSKVGATTSAGAVTVTPRPTPIKGSDLVTAKIDGSGFKATDKNTAASAIFVPAVNTFTIASSQRTGKVTDPRLRTFGIANAALPGPIDQLQLPLTLTGASAGLAQLIDSRPVSGQPGTIYTSSGLALTLSIDSVSGNRVSGSFSGQMREAGGSRVIDIQNGKFVLTLEQ